MLIDVPFWAIHLHLIMSSRMEDTYFNFLASTENNRRYFKQELERVGWPEELLDRAQTMFSLHLSTRIRLAVLLIDTISVLEKEKKPDLDFTKTVLIKLRNCSFFDEALFMESLIQKHNASLMTAMQMNSVIIMLEHRGRRACDIAVNAAKIVTQQAKLEVIGWMLGDMIAQQRSEGPVVSLEEMYASTLVPHLIEDHLISRL